MSITMSKKRLINEFKQLQKNPYSEFSISLKSDDNLSVWEVMLFGPIESPYEGGMFKCEISFPKEYPHKPPVFKFISKMYHPNVYKDGKVCISILHEGSDPYGYEQDCERWTPALSASSVIMSIISILADPNDVSPANTDAAIMWRENRKEFNTLCRACVTATLE
jgi:ubiquitin-protein ligase